MAKSEASKPIRYQSTRGGQQGVSFSDAVLSGLATDRGLFVPDRIPSLPKGALCKPHGIEGVRLQDPSHTRFFESLKDLQLQVHRVQNDRQYQSYILPRLVLHFIVI